MGHKGGEARKEQLAAEHGGDASAGYADIGLKGGWTRRNQIAADTGGDVSEGMTHVTAHTVCPSWYFEFVDYKTLLHLAQAADGS